MFRRSFAALLVALLLAVGGCGGSRLAPVEGVLRIDGKPLPNIQVEFWPETEGRRSTGITDDNGHYRLTTDDERAGAMVGPHRVVLHDAELYHDAAGGQAKGDPNIKPKTSRIPPQYTLAGKTPLREEVKSSANFIDLEIKSK